MMGFKANMGRLPSVGVSETQVFTEQVATVVAGPWGSFWDMEMDKMNQL